MEDIHVIRTGLLAVNTLIVPIGKEIPKKVFVVDPATSDFSRDSNKVVEYLQKNKLECVGILLTHTHFDHIMGVKVIKDAFPNAKIAVHRAESSEINDAPGKMNCDILSLFQMEPLIRSLSNLPKVDILLEDNFDLSVLCNSNSSESEEIILQKKCLEQWKVIHTPGHSPGSVCYYNEEMQILISGDTLFDYGGYGRTDMTGGDESLLRKSLNKLGQIIKKGTKVYPGHDSFGFSF